MKTIDEVKQTALDMWYKNGYVKGDNPETRQMWVNGFCIGYFQGKLDELREKMTPTIGENLEN